MIYLRALHFALIHERMCAKWTKPSMRRLLRTFLNEVHRVRQGLPF